MSLVAPSPLDPILTLVSYATKRVVFSKKVKAVRILTPADNAQENREAALVFRYEYNGKEYTYTFRPALTFPSLRLKGKPLTEYSEIEMHIDPRHPERVDVSRFADMKGWIVL